MAVNLYPPDSPDDLALVKLQAEEWELNIRAPLAEFARLRDVRAANWDTRSSLRVGSCAGGAVFWTGDADGGWATILIGQDDEAWEVGIRLPLSTVDEIAAAASV